MCTCTPLFAVVTQISHHLEVAIQVLMAAFVACRVHELLLLLSLTSLSCDGVQFAQPGDFLITDVIYLNQAGHSSVGRASDCRFMQ